MADALHDAALRLDARQGRVNRNAAIHDRHVIKDLHLTGELVQLNLHHADHVRRRRNRGGMRGRRLGGDGVKDLRFVGDLPHADALLAVRADNPALLKDDVRFLAAHHPGGDGADALFKVHTGLFHRLAGDVRRGGCVGAGVVGRSIRIRAEHGNVLHAAVHALGNHLREDRVAAGAHIRRADNQVVAAILVQFDRRGAHVHVGDTGTLHPHRHACRAHLAVAHVAHGVLFIPVKHLAAVRHAAVQRAGVGHLVIVGGHEITFSYHAALADDGRINAQLLRQLADGGFQSKDALRRAIAAVRARRLMVGVHHVVGKAVRLQRPRVHRD